MVYTCSMWRMLLPYLLFLISIILFLKTDIRILYTFKDRARSPCNGSHFSSILTIVFPDTRTVEYQPIFHGET